MSKYHLHVTQALELFARLASAADKKPYFKELSTAELVLKLKEDKYVKEYGYVNLADRVFGRVKDIKGNSVIANKQWFGTFFRSLRQGEPIVIEDTILAAIIIFINKDSGEAPYRLTYPDIIQELVVPSQVSKFEDSYWYMWTYEYWEKTKDDYTKFREPVIVRQVLHFQKFGKIEMLARNIQKGWDQDYVGYYWIGPSVEEDKHLNDGVQNNTSKENKSLTRPGQGYTGVYWFGQPDNNFLNIRMKIKYDGNKTLNMLYHIGTGDISVAVGEYNNIGLEMYCGPLLIEKTPLDHIDRSEALAFYKIDDERVPKHIRKLYDHPLENMVSMPKNVTNMTTLAGFLADREEIRKRYKKS